MIVVDVKVKVALDVENGGYPQPLYQRQDLVSQKMSYRELHYTTPKDKDYNLTN